MHEFSSRDTGNLHFMKEVHDLQHDPRFAHVTNLSEALKTQVALGRVSVRAASSLSWLDGFEQHRVVQWLQANPHAKIGSLMARRLSAAKEEGTVLDSACIARLLHTQDGRTTRRWVGVPLSELPQGLSYEQAKAWVAQAIEYYKLSQGKNQK